MTTAATITYGLPFADYLRLPQLSQSVLKVGMRESMAHLKAAWDGEIASKPTDAVLMGSALDCAFLEPELLPERVVLWDGERRSGKAWDAFAAKNAGRVILTKGMHAKLVGMVKAAARHPWVRGLRRSPDEVQATAIGELEGVPFKGRADLLVGEDTIVDVKKVRSADAGIFWSQVVEYGYDVQAAVYRELFNRPRVIFLTVEEDAPWDVVPYEMSEAVMDEAWERARGTLRRVRECLAKNAWPGRSARPVMLGAGNGVRISGDAGGTDTWD